MSNIDQIALEAATSISHIDPDTFVGGRTQAKARIQCIIAQAIKEGVAEVGQERDALAAHVEQLQCRLSPSSWPMEEQPDGSATPVDPSDYFGTPAASLAQRDAWVAAEALEHAEAVIMTMTMARQCTDDDQRAGGMFDAAASVADAAHEYRQRQQAEGGDE